jgi:hypothetical protein
MRIWDISPGYLNRNSLLGEHRELHGIISIISNKKLGYSRHPETIRWIGHGWALKMRHAHLSCEMTLRGYADRSPVDIESTNLGIWPSLYVDEPDRQYELLEEKYKTKERGRIPLPKSLQQLWSQHKYSVLARDQNLYKDLGRHVAATKCEFSETALLLIQTLRMPPKEGGIRNSLHHMWGYVSNTDTKEQFDVHNSSLKELLLEIQKRAKEKHDKYILESTALSELMVWLVNT